MAERKRSRHRYVVFDIEADSRINERELADFLTAKARLVYFDGSRGILRCAHTAKEDIIAFVNGKHTIGRCDVTIKTIGTSGTIRRARMKFMERI